VRGHPGAWYFAPGLFLIGTGLGVMLTPSVNGVQSAFPENLQGEISGLSRSVSNLGSSIGTAIAGTILVAGLADARRSYGIAMVVLAFIGLIGLGATVLLPNRRKHQLVRQTSARPCAGLAVVFATQLSVSLWAAVRLASAVRRRKLARSSRSSSSYSEQIWSIAVFIPESTR
jgi:hypothetical protein